MTSVSALLTGSTVVLLAAGLASPSAYAQTRPVAPARATTSRPTPPSPAPQAARPIEPSRLPVRRVVLYKTGVGYFEHVGRVTGNQAITIDLTTGQLDDVLKSLTTVDLSGGRVTGISFNSTAPLEQRLRTTGVSLGTTATPVDVLTQARGSRVEVTAGPRRVTGRVVDVQAGQTRVRGDRTQAVDVLQLLADDGALHVFDLDPSVVVRLLDGQLRGDLGEYLDAIAASNTQDVRQLTVRTSGSGSRDLAVSYVSEVPMWKSSYRLVVPTASEARPFLQGWAIVDNTLGDDWTDVQLSLVAGAPQSFVSQLSQPLYLRRPVVPVTTTATATPQTHEAALTGARASVAGVVVDSGAGPVPGAIVRLEREQRTLATMATNATGEFAFDGLLAGPVEVHVELAGFQREVRSVDLQEGKGRFVPVILKVGELTESVTVTVAGEDADARNTAAAPMPTRDAVTRALGQQSAAATAGDLGELFEYAIAEPVSIARNQSAMVPIVQGPVGVERVSLWNAAFQSPRPRRAVWLTNDTGATLDGGSVTLLEGGAFAGEGLLTPMKPAERRLVSFALDMATQVATFEEGGPRVTTRMQIARGVLTQHIEQRRMTRYEIRNDGPVETTLVVEHPRRDGWTSTGTGVQPAESTAEVHRYRVKVPARASHHLTVHEVRPTETVVELSTMTEDQIGLMLRGGTVSVDEQARLRRVITLQQDLARAREATRVRTDELARIAADQARVRENLSALEGTAAERALVQRYARQLAAQEDRLEVLRREIESGARAEQAVRDDLARLIESLTLDVVVP